MVITTRAEQAQIDQVRTWRHVTIDEDDLVLVSDERVASVRPYLDDRRALDAFLMAEGYSVAHVLLDHAYRDRRAIVTRPEFELTYLDDGMVRIHVRMLCLGENTQPDTSREVELYRPARLVDNANYVWRGGLDPVAGWVYSPDHSRPWDVVPVSSPSGQKLEQLRADRGRVRPVVEPGAADIEVVRAALADAGKQAVATLAWVLHMVVRSAGVRSLLAGMRNEMRAQYLHEFEVWGGTVDMTRVDDRAARVLRNLVLDWLWNPCQVVEAVEVLVRVLGEVADAHAVRRMADLGVDAAEEPEEAAALAWYSVADRIIQPDAFEGAHRISRAGYAVLLGSSATFALAWWDQWDAGLRPDWEHPETMAELFRS